MNRREAFVAIGFAAFVRVGLARLPMQQVHTGGDSMSRDISRVGAHVYSEEGIPMFLACENTAAPKTRPPGTPYPSYLNQTISSAFKKHASEWQSQHPNASASDVAKIVEVLAERDFAQGGMERSL